MENRKNSESIVRRTGRGFLTTTVLKIIFTVVVTGKQIILARLLLPEYFGIVAFITVVLSFITTTTGVFKEDLIIQSKDDIQNLFETVFTLQLIIMATAVFLILIGSPFIGSALKKPHIVPYLQVLCFSLLGQALFLPTGILRRSLNFFRAQFPEVAGAVVGFLVSVILALMNFGIWSLIYGTLSNLLTKSIFLWSFMHWRIRLRIHSRCFSRIWSFSLPLYIAAIFNWFYWKMDDFLVGFWLGDLALGYYWFAFYIPNQIQLLSMDIVRYVTYPILAVTSNSINQLSDVYQKSIKYSSIAAALLCSVMIPLADRIIEYIFGEKWLPATLPFQIFLVLVSARVAFGHWVDLCKAVGDTKILAKVSILQTSLFFILAPLLTLKFAIVGMSVAASAPLVFVIVPISMWLASKRVSINYASLLWKPLVAAIITLTCAIMARDFVIGLASLMLSCTFLTLIFIAIYLLLDRSAFKEMRMFAASTFSK